MEEKTPTNKGAHSMSEVNKQYAKSIQSDIEDYRWDETGRKYGATPFSLHRPYAANSNKKEIVQIPISLCGTTIGDIELHPNDALRLASLIIESVNQIV